MPYRQQLILGTGIIALAVVITFARLSLQPLNEVTLAEVAGEKITQVVAPAEVEATPFAVDCDCEENFETPIKVVIEGKVLANFVGGLDFGVVSDQTHEGKNKFYIIDDGQHPVEVDSLVRVEGQATGLTCAYANTVFGECSLEVESIKVTNL